MKVTLTQEEALNLLQLDKDEVDGDLSVALNELDMFGSFGIKHVEFTIVEAN